MLPTTGFLANASPGLITALERLAREVRLATDDVLFREGDAGDALFAVLDGRLEISVLSGDGRRLVLDILRPGAVFGEIALFDPGPRTATINAIEETRLLRLSHGDMLDEIASNPEFAIDMIRLAGERMRRMNTQIGEQVFLPLPARLARRILYLIGESEAHVALNQAQMADFVGATREAVSKTLGTWKREGLVRASRGGLMVLDRDALRQVAANAET